MPSGCEPPWQQCVCRQEGRPGRACGGCNPRRWGRGCKAAAAVGAAPMPTTTVKTYCPSQSCLILTRTQSMSSAKVLCTPLRPLLAPPGTPPAPPNAPSPSGQESGWWALQVAAAQLLACWRPWQLPPACLQRSRQARQTTCLEASLPKHLPSRHTHTPCCSSPSPSTHTQESGTGLGVAPCMYACQRTQQAAARRHQGRATDDSSSLLACVCVPLGAPGRLPDSPRPSARPVSCAPARPLLIRSPASPVACIPAKPASFAHKQGPCSSSQARPCPVTLKQGPRLVMQRWCDVQLRGDRWSMQVSHQGAHNAPPAGPSPSLLRRGSPCTPAPC